MQILAEAEDLPKTANIKTQLISLWTVPIFGTVLLIAFLAFPGFFPPMSPDMTAEQVAAFYAENKAMVWFTMITFNICGIMLLPLFMVIVVQMKRMATQSHVFAYCYLTAAVSGATLFALADIFFLTAAFRPGRNPELVMLLNDMAWIIFIAPVGALVAMNLLLAAAIYFDERTQPGVSALGRALLPRHGSGDGACGRRRDLQDRPAGVGRCGVVLAAQRLIRALRARDVLRAEVGAPPPGRRGRGRRTMSSAVSTAKASNTELVDTEPPTRAGKRDVWIVFWIVPAFYTAFGIIFFALARVMPPPRPDVTTDQMVDFFHAHSTTIKIGFGILVLIVGGAGVANGIVMYHIKRMTVGSVLGYAYMGSLAIGALPGCLLVAFCFLTAVYRPDRDPELLALLYDLGLLSYVGSLGCFTTAWIAFAIAILYDKNQIFPKWFAYVTVWQIVTEVMAVPVFISKAGPFAWNGSIAFWEGTVIFGIWISCLIVLLKKANELQPSDEAPLP